MTRATITEVAARAGVTKSTVSHALSGKRPVAPETRQRIEAAIAELGYRPNPVAQRLAAGRSRALGLVFPPEQGEITVFDTPFISAAANAAARRGHALVLVQPGESSVAPADLLADGLLDGAILLRVGLRDARVDAARSGDLPFVLIGRTADNAYLSYADIDVEAAVDIAVEHLVGLGHRRLAFLGAADNRDGAALRARQAYELACARRRIRLIAAAGPLSARGAQAAAAALLQGHEDITGLLAWSEWIGWGARGAAAESGRRVPEDLSIVCLGQGIEHDLLPFEPTRVDLQPGRLADAAVSLLLEQLDGDAAGEQQILLRPELIIGQTTAAI